MPEESVSDGMESWLPTPEQIELDIDTIKRETDALIAMLAKYCRQTECAVLMAHNQAGSDDAEPSKLVMATKEDAFSSYRYQYGVESGNRHPQRVLGCLYLPDTCRDEVVEKVDLINKHKNDLKMRLNQKIKRYHERQRLIRSLYPSVLIQSIYRRINIAPEMTYRVNYSWSDKARSVDEISYDDVEAIMKEHAHTMVASGHANGMSEADILNNDLKKLGCSDGQKFLIVKPIKMFPQQIYQYFDHQGGRHRRTIKATSPLIVFFTTTPIEITHKRPKMPKCISDVDTCSYVPVLPERHIYRRVRGG